VVSSLDTRIAIGERILDAVPGTSATVPRNTPHSWRNIASEESRLLAIITPGGFEQIVYALKDTPPEKIRDLAAGFGCDILGPPVSYQPDHSGPMSNEGVVIRLSPADRDAS
jgi:hypothetical protein